MIRKYSEEAVFLSGDIIADDRTIKKARVNDIAAVENAGAYGYSTSSNHSCRLKQ